MRPVARSALAVLVCLAAASPVPAAAEEFVVFVSNFPRLPVGKVLGENTAIDIPATAAVVLISCDGVVLSITGPYTGSPHDPARPGCKDRKFVAEAVKAARTLAKAKIEPGTVGAPMSENGWAIAAGPGVRCVREGVPTVLWRPDGAGELSFGMREVAGSAAAEVVWRAGVQVAPWPYRLALADGAQFDLGPPQGKTERMTFRVVGWRHATDGYRAVFMAAQGCEAQAMALVTGAR